MTRFNSMNPLQNTVTWCKKHLGGWQTTQKGKINKAITSFKKLISFLFKVSLGSFPSSKVVLYHVTVFCKGLLKEML